MSAKKATLVRALKDAITEAREKRDQAQAELDQFENTLATLTGMNVRRAPGAVAPRSRKSQEDHYQTALALLSRLNNGAVISRQSIMRQAGIPEGASATDVVRRLVEEGHIERIDENKRRYQTFRRVAPAYNHENRETVTRVHVGEGVVQR